MRLDYSLNFFLEILVVEVFGLIFLYFFLGEADCLQFDHHLG